MSAQLWSKHDGSSLWVARGKNGSAGEVDLRVKCGLMTDNSFVSTSARSWRVWSGLLVLCWLHHVVTVANFGEMGDGCRVS